MEYNLSITGIDSLTKMEKSLLHDTLMEEAKFKEDIEDYVFAVIEYDYGDNSREYDLRPLHIRDFQQGGYSDIYIEFTQLIDVTTS